MDFNTMNKHLVTSSGRNAVRIMRITSETVLDRHDALVLAAWIVAMVDWDDTGHADFEEALALVTAT